MADLRTLAVSTRESHSSTTEMVQAVSTPTREGYGGVGELVGYGEIFHDRTAYASVDQLVLVGAVSTREGYAYVGELIDYDSIYHDRTAYASVETAVTFRLPEFDEVTLAIMGWGVPLQPAQVMTILRGASEGVSSVSEFVGVDQNPVSSDAGASVDSNVVSSL